MLNLTEARARRSKRYFTGKPCPRNHVSERYVCNYKCIECMREDQNQDRILGLRGYREKAKNRTKKWRAENPGRKIANVRERETLQKVPVWADAKLINDFYVVAGLLSQLIGEPCQVDHIIPVKGKNVCGLHIESNLQILLASENGKKGRAYEVV